MYRITFYGFRDPDFEISIDDVENIGNIVSVEDETVPDYDFEELYDDNRDNILGMFIEKFMQEKNLTSLQKKTLHYGTKALLDAMEDRL